MRPKKIYIDPNEMYNGDGFGTFSNTVEPDRTAEYIDLTQVWHSGKRKPKADVRILLDVGGNLLYGYFDKDFKEYHYTTSVDTPLKLCEVKRWAYIKDLLPKENDNGE